MGFCLKRQVLPALLLFHYSTHFFFCLSAMQEKRNGKENILILGHSETRKFNLLFLSKYQFYFNVGKWR
jgi:hypothetical protein